MQARLDIIADREGLARALARWMGAAAEEALAARGRFMAATAGGTALGLLGEGLALERIDAGGWDWFFADERCVRKEDAQSNRGQAQRELFGPLGIGGERVHEAEGERGPEGAARAYEGEIARAFGLGRGEWPAFDAVVLGVGEDGHVASLFPGAPALFETRRRVVPVLRAPKPPPARISMSLPTLNAARRMAVAAAGAEKAPIVAAAFGGGAEEEPRLPFRRLKPAGGELVWMVDRAAAAGLGGGGAAAKEKGEA